jgi:hypothetical protein
MSENMVSPVRIRVPPLTKVLQISRKCGSPGYRQPGLGSNAAAIASAGVVFKVMFAQEVGRLPEKSEGLAVALLLYH